VQRFNITAYLYYKERIFITKSVSLLQRAYLYYKERIFITKSVSLLQREYLYYKERIFITKSVTLLQRAYLYYKCFLCRNVVQGQFGVCWSVLQEDPNGPYGIYTEMWQTFRRSVRGKSLQSQWHLLRLKEDRIEFSQQEFNFVIYTYII